MTFNTPRLLAARRTASGSGFIEINGATTASGITNTGAWNTGSAYYIGASQGVGILNARLPEIILYNTGLSADERNRVESYLAIKYGMTLDSGNYTNSTGTVIWNVTTQSGYNRNMTII